MNAFGAAFGVYDPAKIVRAAKNYMTVTGGDATTHAAAAKLNLSGLGAVDGATAALAIVGGAVLLVLVARGAAGWYIGKQFKRPYWGIAAGAIGGAPGLGILSLFPGR